MKTRNKLFTAAAILAFVLFAGNVFATEKEAFASSHESITETSLQIENWMTSNDVWDVEDSKMILQETDADLDVENWMTDDDVWSTGYFETVAHESDMSVENWMINNEYWKI